uniref:ATP synthase subunit a n=1 Tax=Bramus fuscocapillus TaxID=3370997 RepID=A0A873AA13_9RODE|nr:ATP synthase F0 subunit 6 [Ellobius fuscocapillus]
MNENLFSPFITPTLMGFPIVILIIALPSVFLTPSKRLISNRLHTLQQWLIKLITKQLMLVHTPKGRTWTLMLVSLMMFIGSTNLLGMLPYTFTPTTQLSMNLGMAFPLWAGAVIIGFRIQLKKALAHLLPLGTPITLIPMLTVIETASLLMQPVALAIRLTANITAGHLLMHLISGVTLVLTVISPLTTIVTFALLILLTALEFAVALIQAYVFTLLVSMYVHDNT